MKNLKQTLIAEIEAKKDEISAIADFLLKNPETGYKEFKTSAFVRNELEKL